MATATATSEVLDERQLLHVLMAVKRGDFSVRMPPDYTGLPGKIADALNEVIELNERLCEELKRVSVVVGKEGRTAQRASLGRASEGWATCIESTNNLIVGLVQPTTEAARVIGAVAKGDLSQTMALEIDGRPLTGEFLSIARTVNTMVDQLGGFAAEVTRVAREVGTEGILGGQAEVKGVSGIWKDLTDNVNLMATNLTNQVRNIAEVTTAVANGDLSRKITVDVRGEILELKNTINTMVDQLNSFANEVTRVAREVGTEGILGGQAEVQGVSGTWKDLTDSVNFMAINLTNQVRNIAEVTTAVATGDLSRKITADARGEILDLKNTINTMVDQLGGFAAEVTRVAREVGTEGILGGQAEVQGVAGTWKDLTDSVNFMATNLTNQVRNIAEVTTAVANGDLSRKITADARGEILELKDTINTMVDQLNSFANEVTRVAREVGTEGNLGGQAQVRDVSGTWKDLTDSVNLMASNLTNQVRNIAAVTTAVANGDLSKKITVDVRGEILELKDTINTMVDQLNGFASEVTRVAREVGTEGKLGGQAFVRGVSGTWKDLTDSVNSMASNLTNQVRNIAAVTTAVAYGDLSKKITVDARGEILDLKNTINTMVDQLNGFANEVTRVAREVGTEGKLGGQAVVQGVSGTWKDLTDNVNSMAANLTNQVRGIARVVTAVARGNLKQKLVLEAKGELADLAETINDMIDTLATFADQVTTVAREVGIEGKLGGQANVPGASGTWRDLTDNVNRMAASLTTQVRAIADVATAVTEGDLSRSIAVEAAGEVAALKDNINEMIRNLKDTTLKYTEQDWLKTNLAKFTNLLQGQRDLLAVARLILSELAPLVNAQHGVFYLNEASEDDADLRLLASYAYRERKGLNNRFRSGEGLVGQCAFEKQRILITDAPPDYIRISSGLGDAPPANIVALPVLFEGDVKAVIELASFQRFSQNHLAFLDQLTESIGIVLNTIAANIRTEMLLQQSQSLAQELTDQQQELQETNRRLEQQAQSLQASEELLKRQQEELQHTNEELEEKARQLSDQKHEVERKNRQIEMARQELEEKAEQLALTSKYKSEFLANMSHELRTPLNSMLILSSLLRDNSEGTLSPKQVDYAETIHSSGRDLLALINEILDLAKIESGRMDVDIREVSFADLQSYVERNFREVAQDRRLGFRVELDSSLPPRMRTDPQRLQQVLRNLLSNAFKFTEQGEVLLRMRPASEGWSPGHEVLSRAEGVVAFEVSDTGIGIPPQRQKIIFEAFQQADGTTSRRYGGTGLGLSISREIARLLGGEIGLVSRPGEGSVFTLYLPLRPLEPAETPPDEAPSEPVPTPTPARHSRPSQVEADRIARRSHPDLKDDRQSLQPGDRILLVVEDDPSFAGVLLDLARQRGFKAVVAPDGESGLALAREVGPHAITLDLRLPGLDGWKVLDRLKHDPSTRHIPVHIISIGEERKRGLRLGALAFLQKPATQAALQGALASVAELIERRVRHLLVVQSDPSRWQGVVDLLQSEEVSLSVVESGEAALAALKEQQFDCVIVDMQLPDMSAFELMDRLCAEVPVAHLPIVLYRDRDLTHQESTTLERIADTIIVKDVGSPERVLDEATLFLHQVEEALPDAQRAVLEKLHRSDPDLAGRRALVVDDDIRNVFAITSVLENHHMDVIRVGTGHQCLETLQEVPDIDVILMDVMMPELDGWETIRAIRRMPGYRTVPIIAVTAKAMAGDREQCLEAGASDYVVKPVEPEHLVSTLRVWLSR